jgi:hypothetical protein
MQKFLVSVLTVGMLVGLGGTAQAQRDRYTSSTAQAFWYDREDLTSDTYTLTVWYVGVYSDEGGGGGGGFFSDLYQEVDRCEVGQRFDRCRNVSFEVGYTDLSRDGETFTFDTSGLTVAHLESTYKLQSYDENGNPVGDPEVYSVVTDWTGKGDLTRSHESYSFHQGCTHFTTHVKGLSRRAVATGSLNGTTDLGTTRDAFMARSSYTDNYHNC